MDQMINPVLPLKMSTTGMCTVSEDEMLQLVCMATEHCTGIDMESMRHRTRKEAIRIARHLAMFFLWEKTRISVTVLGEVFNRDHTSVIHGRNSIRDLLDTNDPVVTRLYENIRQILSPFQIQTGHVTERRQLSR